MDDDCWNEILQYCSNEELVRMSSISVNLNKLTLLIWPKRFYDLTKYKSNNVNYQYLYFLILEQEPEEIEKLLSRCFNNITYLNASPMIIPTNSIIDILSLEDDSEFNRRYTNAFIERFEENIRNLELNKIMVENKVLINKLEDIDLNVISLEFGYGRVKYVLENGLVGRGYFNDRLDDYMLNNLYKMEKLKKLSISGYSSYYYLICRPKTLTHLCLEHLGVGFKFLEGIEYLELPSLNEYVIKRLKELPKTIKHVKFENYYYLGEYYDLEFDFEISITNFNYYEI